MITRNLRLSAILAFLLLALAAAVWLLNSEADTLGSDALSRVYVKQPYHHPVTRVTSVTSIMERGVLRIASRNAPTVYYHGADGPEGFEYDLVKDFADYLGVDLEILLYNSVAEILVTS